MKNAMPRVAALLALLLAITFTATFLAVGIAVAASSPIDEGPVDEGPVDGVRVDEASASPSLQSEPTPSDVPAAPETGPPPTVTSTPAGPRPPASVPLERMTPDNLTPPDAAAERQSVEGQHAATQVTPSDHPVSSPSERPGVVGPTATGSPSLGGFPAAPFVRADAGPSAVSSAPGVTSPAAAPSASMTSPAASASATPLDGPRASMEVSTAPILAAVAIGGAIATATIRAAGRGRPAGQGETAGEASR